jgi:hypothetical protein
MSQANPHFVALVASFHSTAMMQLGKIANPMTGKAERDLPGVKETIDLLGMLKEKTNGNLAEEESRFLDHVLYELRINYVEESQNPASGVSDRGAGTSSGDPTN